METTKKILFFILLSAHNASTLDFSAFWNELTQNPSQEVEALDMRDGSKIMTGKAIKRFYQEPAFAIYKRKNDAGINDFGNVAENIKSKNPFEQQGKAYIPVNTRKTYTSAIAQLKDGSLVATGPYEQNKVIIGKWNSLGKPDTQFGDNAKTIVTLHENSFIPGTELSNPRAISEGNNGDLLVFGTFSQGKDIFPFAIRFDKNGSVKEKQILKEDGSQAKAPISDVIIEENQVENTLNMNTYPQPAQNIPGMISAQERQNLMNQ